MRWLKTGAYKADEVGGCQRFILWKRIILTILLKTNVLVKGLDESVPNVQMYRCTNVQAYTSGTGFGIGGGGGERLYFFFFN